MVKQHLFPDFKSITHQLERGYFPNLKSFIEIVFFNRLKYIKSNLLTFKVFVSEALYNASVRKEINKGLPNNLILSLNFQLENLKFRHLLINWPNSTIIEFLVYNFLGFVLNQLILFNPKNKTQIDQAADTMITFLSRGLAPIP